jgi:uncharacterized metal-binding protein
VNPRCAQCEVKQCRDGKDCFSKFDDHWQLYLNDQTAGLHQVATAVEGQYYCKETRLGETIFFAKKLGYRKIGLAFCIGLSEEAGIIAEILSGHFDVVSVCCKVSGINKQDFELQQIDPEAYEVMCNPAGQAQLLNEAGTQLNIICGLCVGHDAIFNKTSKAPVTTLIAKDRVLAHNPAAAIYCQYIRRRFDENRKVDK